MKPTPPSDSKVTLETLLRLKRAERPSAEFWAEFDAGLRRKQLVAMVERKSTWRTLVGGLSRWTWVGLPAGTAAAGVLVWMAMRPATTDVPTAVTSPALASIPAVTPTPATDSTETLAPASAPILIAAEPSTETTAAAVVQTTPEIAPRATPESVGAFAFWAGGQAAEIKDGSFSRSLSLEPSLRLDGVPALKPVAARSSDFSSDHEVSAWSDPKKARLMAYADTTLSSNNPDRLRASRSDRATRRLSEQALADNLGRLDMGGDRVTIRF